MKLFLLRHGEAEPRAETDAKRQLTYFGRQQAVDVALQFADKGGKVDRCLVSPYTRAIQTADSFLSRIAGAPNMEIQALLTPEVRAAEVLYFLECQPAVDSILLVSHNPLISELNALLVEGVVGNDMMILGTCELCAIELDILGVGTGRRRYSLNPVNV